MHAWVDGYDLLQLGQDYGVVLGWLMIRGLLCVVVPGLG
jgi:hypothetical protein